MKRREFLGALLAIAAAPFVTLKRRKLRTYTTDRYPQVVFRESAAFIACEDSEEISPGVYRVTCRPMEIGPCTFDVFHHGMPLSGLRGSDFKIEKRL